MIKYLTVSSIALLLIGCQANQSSDTPTDDAAADEGIEEVVSTDINTTPVLENPLSDLMNEDSFVDEYAFQAWSDYQEVVHAAVYGEVTILNQEEPDLSSIERTSSIEIDDRLTSMGLREDVYKEVMEQSEVEMFHFYRYPAEEGSEYQDISDFLAELTFYFVEDHLMFSSITPGLYALELNNLNEVSTLTTFQTVAEIEAINPQVFTIAEMSINGKLIRQVMIPATHVNEEGTQENLAFYFFIHNETILQYAYLPFEMVMQSFPDYAMIVYQELIPVLEEIEL